MNKYTKIWNLAVTIKRAFYKITLEKETSVEKILCFYCFYDILQKFLLAKYFSFCHSRKFIYWYL